MLRASLCDYSDSYILVKGTITVRKTAAAEAANNANKKVTFKNCSQTDDTQYIDAVMPMYNLT